MSNSTESNRLDELVNQLKESGEEQLADDLQEGEVEFIPEGSSFTEQLLRTVIKGYQEAFNRQNEKFEVKYELTITNHKIATPEGNKDIAYLRLDKSIKAKEVEEWENVGIVHQEVYYFKNLKERVNHKAPWKEQLYVNAIARLMTAGLEYAELLKRLSQVERNEKAVEEAKSSIEVSKEMPVPLSDKDEEYKKWLATERAKWGNK